jgi:serine/threonine-protein kinase
MAVVVAAKHLQLRETVAVKLLHPHVLANPRSVERFLREARVTMRLRGEHVARVYDVGALDDRTPFVVMESLDGADLGAVLRDRGRLPVGEAVDYVLQACEAVAEAHALGIVHRDLKPANLFLTTRVDGTPSVKVLDFGVSKILDSGTPAIDLDAGGDALGTFQDAESFEETAPPSLPASSGQTRSREESADRPRAGASPAAVGESAERTDLHPVETMTLTHAFLGSPKYVAPEQLRSARDVDARADVWALGVILHELVNGVPPFQGDTLDALSQAILHAPPAAFVIKGQAALESLLARCLAKDRTERLPSVLMLAEALGPLASGEGRLSMERIVRMGSGGAGRSSEYPSTPPQGVRQERPTAPTRKALRRWAAVAAGAGAVGLAILARRAPARPPAAGDPGIDASGTRSAPASSVSAAEPSVGPVPSTSAASVVPVAAPSATAPGPARLQEPRRPSRAAPSRASSTADPLGVPGGQLFDTRR